MRIKTEAGFALIFIEKGMGSTKGGQPFLVRPEPRFKGVILRGHQERIGCFFAHERPSCIPSAEEVAFFRGGAYLDALPAVAFSGDKARLPFAFIFACKGESIQLRVPFGCQNNIACPSAFDGRDVVLPVVPAREFVALPRRVRQ